MITQEEVQKEVDEITHLIRYSVNRKDRDKAVAFLQKHRNDPLYLSLLKEFYSALPEGIEEPVLQVTTIRRRRGSSLVAVSTEENEYVYFADKKRAVFICRVGEKVDEQEILDYFEYPDSNEMIKELKSSTSHNQPKQKEASSGCPVCLAVIGEVHEFGCPLEICPWCDGQLTHCNCRFDKLGVDEIVNEEQLRSLFELLNEKGRIPYKKEQGLSYPSDRRG